MEDYYFLALYLNSSCFEAFLWLSPVQPLPPIRVPPPLHSFPLIMHIHSDISCSIFLSKDEEELVPIF